MNVNPVKIRPISDIHLEFGPIDLPVIEDEKNTVLILAGDIGLATKPGTFRHFVREMCKRHRAVIYICGNHEHYAGNLDKSLTKLKDGMKIGPIPGVSFLKFPSNLHIVEREIVRVDHVSFVCATLWTNYHKGDPHTMLTAEMAMNDYRHIRCGPDYRKLRARKLYDINLQSSEFIFNSIRSEKASGQRVTVVSHHAPSEMSIHPIYKTEDNQLVNGAYASEYGYQILDTEPNLWIHGHTHFSFDYEIGNTRIVCNPRGYVGHELNEQFNDRLVIEI